MSSPSALDRLRRWISGGPPPNPAGPQAAGTGNAGPHASGLRQQRAGRREQLFALVRENMIRMGVLSSHYKFKVLTLDPAGEQFIVMVDWHMPVLTGIEFVTAVRQPPYGFAGLVMLGGAIVLSVLLSLVSLAVILAVAAGMQPSLTFDPTEPAAARHQALLQRREVVLGMRVREPEGDILVTPSGRANLSAHIEKDADAIEREGLSAEARARKAAEASSDLLARIRGFFHLG